MNWALSINRLAPKILGIALFTFLGAALLGLLLFSFRPWLVASTVIFKNEQAELPAPLPFDASKYKLNISWKNTGNAGWHSEVLELNVPASNSLSLLLPRQANNVSLYVDSYRVRAATLEFDQAQHLVAMYRIPQHWIADGRLVIELSARASTARAVLPKALYVGAPAAIEKARFWQWATHRALPLINTVIEFFVLMVVAIYSIVGGERYRQICFVCLCALAASLLDLIYLQWTWQAFSLYSICVLCVIKQGYCVFVPASFRARLQNGGSYLFGLGLLLPLAALLISKAVFGYPVVTPYGVVLGMVLLLCVLVLLWCYFRSVDLLLSTAYGFVLALSWLSDALCLLGAGCEEIEQGLSRIAFLAIAIGTVTWLAKDSLQVIAREHARQENLTRLAVDFDKRFEHQKEALNSQDPWVRTLISSRQGQDELRRTILSLIVSAEYLSERSHKLEDQVFEKHANLILRSAKRCLRLVDRFRRFCHYPEAKTHSFELSTWLQASAQELAHHDKDLLVRCPHSLPIKCDPDLLFEVLTELVDNAYYQFAAVFNPRSVEINAAFDHVNRRWYISVRDWGTGGEPEPVNGNLLNLCTPMVSSKIYGLGLGLSLVLRDTVAMGGHLHVVQLQPGFLVTAVLPSG